MHVKSNLKKLLDERGMSIRELSRKTDTSFESIRRIYNDDSMQYGRKTIGRICSVLNVGIDELLLLVNEEADRNDLLQDEIQLLDLPPRIYNAIIRHRYAIKTIGELCELNLAHVPGLGPNGIKTIENCIANYYKKIQKNNEATTETT